MRRVFNVAVRTAAALAFVGAPSTLTAQTSEPFDIVLAGGRVMDPEAGLDGIRWVGIRGESVAAISDRPLDGRTVIDATGLVVAPDFIDLHAHGQSLRANQFQAMDGVTTALEMESGVPDMEAFLAQRAGSAVVNYGATIGHGGSRTWVMSEYAAELEAALAANAEGQADRAGMMRLYDAAAAGRYDALEPARYPDLWERLDAGLRAGALGIGMPHQYYPGVTRDEIFRLFQFAAERDVPIYTHFREMGVEPIQEVVVSTAPVSGTTGPTSTWSWEPRSAAPTSPPRPTRTPPYPPPSSPRFSTRAGRTGSGSPSATCSGRIPESGSPRRASAGTGSRAAWSSST